MRGLFVPFLLDLLSLPHYQLEHTVLPTITDPVIIDGTTQPGFAGKPIVELNGAGALPIPPRAASDVYGLQVTADSSTIRGLIINRFSGRGIDLNISNGNVIEGNFIGTDVTGSGRARPSDHRPLGSFILVARHRT